VTTKNIEHRTAEALVATFVQMSRSAEMARWLQQLRQRSLESRVRRTSDARELLKLQARLDAQQGQAAVLEAATTRFRGQAPNLAQFARAGLTIEDFHRLGAHHVVDPAWLASEVEKVKAEDSAHPEGEPAPAPAPVAHAQPAPAAAATAAAPAKAPRKPKAAGGRARKPATRPKD
jgi:hypothetical protein